MGPEEASDAGMLCMCVCVCATLCVELKKLADILSPRAETLQKSTIHAHGAPNTRDKTKCISALLNKTSIAYNKHYHRMRRE